MKRLSLCIAGKNRIAVECLRYVVEHYGARADIYAICNSGDNGMDNWQPSLRKYAASLKNVAVINLEEAQDISDVYFFSLEFDRIIKPERFNSKNLFNLHFSLLPKYRGMYTSAHPLLNGETESGCTLHIIDSGIDTGAVVNGRRRFPCAG